MVTHANGTALVGCEIDRRTGRARLAYHIDSRECVPPLLEFAARPLSELFERSR